MFELHLARRIEGPGHVTLWDVLQLISDLRSNDHDGSFGQPCQDTATLAWILHRGGGPVSAAERLAVQREADLVFAWFATSGYRPGRDAQDETVAVAEAVARGAEDEVVGPSSFVEVVRPRSGWDSENLTWGPGERVRRG